MWDACVHFLEIKATVRVLGKTGRSPGGFWCLLAALKALAPQGETFFQKRNLPQNPLNKQQKAPAFRRGLLLVCVVKEREKWEISILLSGYSHILPDN